MEASAEGKKASDSQLEVSERCATGEKQPVFIFSMLGHVLFHARTGSLVSQMDCKWTLVDANETVYVDILKNIVSNILLYFLKKYLLIYFINVFAIYSYRGEHPEKAHYYYLTRLCLKIMLIV